MIGAIVVARTRERETAARKRITRKGDGKEMIFSFAVLVFVERCANDLRGDSTIFEMRPCGGYAARCAEVALKFSKCDIAAAMPPDVRKRLRPSEQGGF